MFASCLIMIFSDIILAKGSPYSSKIIELSKSHIARKPVFFMCAFIQRIRVAFGSAQSDENFHHQHEASSNLGLSIEETLMASVILKKH